ncbi:type VII secretion integral membrane protein EccD [Kitasatospora azatica]|uniref:type VII secretion integral membrane protein EccD n=1 Tax=Kitasatospora azatica TaxID=58347 RepID=UPI0007C7048C|nr:type VII secretion integral membrane protein EccD [Kitasatospora azatica]
MPNDLCRLVLVTSDRALDVAVPADVPISYLLPTLLRHAGGDLADGGTEHEGWVLQRLGEAPLDEDATVAAAGLHDGDRLYFRPRREQLPAIDFDDLVAGLSQGISERPDRWTAAMTRWMFLGLLTAALAIGLALVLLPGSSAPRGYAAGGVALVLLLTGTVASRALGDATAGLLLGCAALPYGALGGLLAQAPRAGQGLGAPALLSASACVLVCAVLGALGVGVHRRVFLAVGTAALCGAVGGVIATGTAATGVGAGACVAVLALALNPLVPTLSFRLAGLRVPPLPADVDELLKNTEPLDAERLAERAAATDQFMAALFFATGATCVGALTALGHGRGWGAPAVILCVCAGLLLRSRLLISGWQRLALLVPAAYGLAVLAVHLAAGADQVRRLGVGLGAVLAASLLLLSLSRTMPERRLLPYWGRAAEILEILVAVALAPLAVAVLGVFGWAHALGA